MHPRFARQTDAILVLHRAKNIIEQDGNGMSVGGEFKMAIYTQVFEWEFAGCFSHASQCHLY